MTAARRLFVVTGASRGLGHALAAQLLDAADATVLAISRGEHAALAERARWSGARFEEWRADLADPLPVAARLERWLADVGAAPVASATLVNNAALLTRIGPLDRCTADELSAAARVGLEAPLLLSAAFLRATARWPAPRRILNVSSGLGRRPMAGQATYCAIKAGLDHLTRALALDEAGKENGARVVSLAPGVIDTDMQAQLRSAGDEGFPDRSMFVGLKEGGTLASPQAAARRLVDFLSRADFGSEPVADVRG